MFGSCPDPPTPLVLQTKIDRARNDGPDPPFCHLCQSDVVCKLISLNHTKIRIILCSDLQETPSEHLRDCGLKTGGASS